MFAINKKRYPRTAEILSKALKHIEHPRPHSLLVLMKKISKTLPVMAPKTDKMLGKIKTEKIDVEHQYLFLQYTLGANAGKYMDFCLECGTLDLDKFDKELAKIVQKTANEAIKKSPEF
jgi:hypothetical protein